MKKAMLDELLSVYQKELIKAGQKCWEEEPRTTYTMGYTEAIDLALDEIHAMMTVIEEKLNITLTHYY